VIFYGTEDDPQPGVPILSARSQSAEDHEDEERPEPREPAVVPLDPALENAGLSPVNLDGHAPGLLSDFGLEEGEFEIIGADDDDDAETGSK